MSTSQQFLVCDNSTVANFKSWASALSNQLRTFGWTNTADTGQLNGAGANNWAGVSTFPGSGLFYYEIFQPGDGLTTYYLKLEYGNTTGSANSPTVRISIGTGTTGAGVLTGFVTQLVQVAGSSFAPPSAITTYECDFSGTSSRLSILLWRNAPNNAPQCFAIQRSINASGVETGSYITIWTAGYNPPCGYQQSLLFGVGPARVFPNRVLSASFPGWPARPPGTFTFAGTSAFNGSIPIDCLQPNIGFWDYPCTVIATSFASDLAEGVAFSITNQYGQTKTYMPTKQAPLGAAATGSTGESMTCVEYD